VKSNKRQRVATLATLAMFLAGCAGQRSATLPVQPAAPQPPPRWTAPAPDGASSAALAVWWQHFGDPVLPVLVAQALAQGTSVEAAGARLRQARAQAQGAQAGLAPTLAGSGSARVTRSEGGVTQRPAALGLDAGWEIDLWGGSAAGRRAAEASAEASAATLAGVRTATAAEVALHLLQLRGTQARLSVAQDNLANQEQTLQIVAWRAQAGLVSALDLLQARTAVEQTRAQIPALETAAAQSANALAVLTGQAPGALSVLLAPATPALPPATPPDLALALPADVLRQRPDLRAAEFQWLAAEARLAQADTQRLPSLRLGGSIGLNALGLGQLASGTGVISLLAGVNLPLLDGGRLRAQASAQEAARDEAAAAYRATLLAALQEVEDALVMLHGTRGQLLAQQAALAAAASAAAVAEQRYRSGLVDFQNVLQTQRSRLAAQDAVAATATTLAMTHVRLYKALGGGWAPLTDAGSDKHRPDGDPDTPAPGPNR
jgi:multidrug efflux system outer membrane protein